MAFDLYVVHTDGTWEILPKIDFTEIEEQSVLKAFVYDKDTAPSCKLVRAFPLVNIRSYWVT